MAKNKQGGNPTQIPGDFLDGEQGGVAVEMQGEHTQGVATLDRAGAGETSQDVEPAPFYSPVEIRLKPRLHQRIAVFWKNPKKPDAPPERYGSFDNHTRAAKFIEDTRKHGAEIRVVYVDDDGFACDEHGNREQPRGPAPVTTDMRRAQQEAAVRQQRAQEVAQQQAGLTPRRMIQQLLDALSNHPDAKVKYVANGGTPGKTEAIPHIAPAMQEKLTIQLIYKLDK